MPLTSGTRLGVYEVVAPLGAGGMGEVYRARDTKLGRDVAIKILPDSFVNDPERIARFEREAQLLAALNHPHIAAIYGLESSGSTQYLVLELVEGETLDARLKARAPGQPDGARGADTFGARGFSRALPLDEALSIARQIADALQAAHDKGIIHRDLKPANIAVNHDGQVKVLDFGLAKQDVAATGSSAPGGLTQSPTLTTPAMMMTGVGVILGTAAYMSPEQAKGRVADKRSDVWAFGCVLYEMLTGKRAFTGEDITDTIASIMRDEPDWAALPAATPASVRTLVDRCLKKDRHQRIADIAVAQFLLTELGTAEGSSRSASLQRIAPLVVAAGFCSAVIAGATTWALVRRGPQMPTHGSGQMARVEMLAAKDAPFSRTRANVTLLLSPDGTHLIYARDDDGDLVVRPIDQLNATRLPGTGPALQPFLSPGGQSIGYFVQGTLQRTDIAGSDRATICPIAGPSFGGTWTAGDVIVFATGNVPGLLSVPARGGQPTQLTRPDFAAGEQAHLFPSVLPDGHHVLFTIRTQSMSNEGSRIGVFDPTTGRYKVVLNEGEQAHYVEPGYLLYGLEGTLRAVPFDLDRLEVTGPGRLIAQQVMRNQNGVEMFSASRTGTLVYTSQPPGTDVNGRALLWVDRSGKEDSLPGPARAFAYPRLSPDGSRIAVDVRDERDDIWVFELSRRSWTRLTFDPKADRYPVWTADSKRIVFTSTRNGPFNLFAQSADGTGSTERLTTASHNQFPFASIGGTSQVLFRDDVTAGYSLKSVNLETRQERSVLSMDFGENNADVSPDGRWLAYQSRESGRNEIYVRPFPNTEGGRWQISTDGGAKPLWSRDGNELFYVSYGLGGRIAAVGIQTTAGFLAGPIVTAVPTPYYNFQPHRTFDVSLDGNRFLVLKDIASNPPPSAAPTSVVLVMHWTDAFKAKPNTQ